MKNIKYSLLVLALALFSCTNNKAQKNKVEKNTEILAQALPIISGDYDFLSIATDGDQVTGFYSNDRYRGNPDFGCSFYFYGNLTDSIGYRKIAIQTLNPFDLSSKPREGSLKLHSEEDTNLSIIANLNDGGCWDPHLGWTQISEAPGVGFELYTRLSLLEIRIVKEEKVYFYSDADKTTKRKAYVIKNDPLFILERKGNWLKAIFRGAKSETTGWVKKVKTMSMMEIGN